MKRIVILLVVLTLSACGTAPLKEEYPEGGIPPDQWKVLGGATGWFAKA